MKGKEPTTRSKAEAMELRGMCALFVAIFLFGFSAPLMHIMQNNEIAVIRERNAEESTVESTVSEETVSTAETSYEIWESKETQTEETRTASETSVPVQTEETITRVTVVFPLDVNTASRDELMMVKGIGEVTAEKIIEYRKINGYFYSLDELMNVDGIGQKKLAAFEDYLFINYDMLPKTLPPKQTEETAGKAPAVTAVTTVPVSKEKEKNTAVPSKTPRETEEFVMETIEFITEKDKIDNSTDVYYTEKTKTEKVKTQKVTETEYSPSFPLELNSASAKDLTYINGIGEATAEKIVNYAKTYGFYEVDDLLNVSGIGQSKLEMIRPYVYVNSFGVTRPPVQTTAPFGGQQTFTVPQEIPMVNLNTCSVYELMQLPGISTENAEKIISLRNEIGGFQKTEELCFVLTNEQYNKIRSYVYL